MAPHVVVWWILAALARHSSTDSWDVECSDDSDAIIASEKSSLAGEFLGTDNWPLFIQFSATVHVDTQVESISIDFIPNCLKDIFNKCASNSSCRLGNIYRKDF